MPHGLTLKRAGANAEQRLGSIFSDVPIGEGDVFSRPTAGGGGFGDPLERDPNLVIEDVKDDYVSINRAAKEALRAKIRAERITNARLDPDIVAERYRSGVIDVFDVIRQHAVILDWGTGTLLPESTRQFREVFERRSVAMWAAG